MKLEWKTCIRLGITAFLLYLAIYYWEPITGMAAMIVQAASTLILGCLIAYLVNILMSFYETYYFPKSKRAAVEKSKRIVCMLAAILTLLGIVSVVIGLVIPELVNCVKLLMVEVPQAIDDLVEWLRKTGVLNSVMNKEFLDSLAATDWEQKITQMLKVFLDGLGGAAQMAVTAVSSFTAAAVEFVIGAIFSLYLLLGKERIMGQIRKVMDHYLRSSWNRNIRYVLSTFNGCFHRFIVGQCIEAVILGGLCMAGMMVLRLPYAVMVGTLIGFTALIPVAGAYIGGCIGAFMILTVSPTKALGFLIFLAILQQVEGNLIYPRVVGNSIGLPGVWVLAAVTIGGGIMGIPGMLIGVPAAAAVYQLLRNDLNGIKA